MIYKDFYTVDDICEILQVHFQTVRTLLKTKQLKGFKIGRNWRITREDLEAYIKKQKGE